MVLSRYWKQNLLFRLGIYKKQVFYHDTAHLKIWPYSIVKHPNIWTPNNHALKTQIQTKKFYHKIMTQKDAAGTANSENSDQAAPLGAI